jgi:hypothetical protein
MATSRNGQIGKPKQVRGKANSRSLNVASQRLTQVRMHDPMEMIRRIARQAGQVVDIQPLIQMVMNVLYHHIDALVVCLKGLLGSGHRSLEHKIKIKSVKEIQI